MTFKCQRGFMKFFSIMFLFIFSGSAVSALAQGSDDEYGGADTGYEEVFMPELHANSVIIDDDDEWPNEPNLAKVQFKKIPPLSGLGERIDRLVHGIKKDIAPEYDHYGYEIRRYMSTVGNKKIYSDSDFLIEQIKNVRKANVIADYWRKALEEEMDALKEIVENNNTISFSERTTYKQNKVAVRTFLIILRSWLAANEGFLMTILEDPNVYDINYPEIIISDKSRIDFYNKLNLKRAKLKDIRQYQSFAMMVY